jgi:hypothetical protein
VPGGKRKNEINKHTNAETVFCLIVHRGGEYQQRITSKETHDIGTPSVPKLVGKKNWSLVFAGKWIGP